MVVIPADSRTSLASNLVKEVTLTQFAIVNHELITSGKQPTTEVIFDAKQCLWIFLANSGTDTGGPGEYGSLSGAYIRERSPRPIFLLIMR